MQRSSFRRRVQIPSVTTLKSQTKDYEFIKGYDSNTTNDDVEIDKLRYITDAREVQVGKWQTRRGTDRLSIPIGDTVNVQQASTTGAGNFSFSPAIMFAQKVTATSSGALTGISVNVRNTASATGTIVLALFSDSAGTKPNLELFRTTLAASTVTSSYQYLRGYTITCPDIVNGTTYWIVGFVQPGGSNSYQVSTTTAASTAATSTDGGTTWTAQAFAINVKLHTGTAKPTKGCIRIKRPNGTTMTLLAHDTTLYTVNEATGATTAVDTGLDTNATYCRFGFVNDTLYYTQGTTKPRKYDWTTASSVTAAPENAYSLLPHKGLMFYLSADDPNKMYYTNFGLYDTFTSTDFLYIPSPKTGDPSKALAKLNGNLYVITRNSKFVLYGSVNGNFQLENAVGQKGTFSQESIAYDEDSIFIASDDGIYRFNGADEVNIAQDVLDWWNGLSLKSNTVLELHNNRLFVYYTPAGGAINSRCKVYNVLYKIWESDDTATYVGRTYTRYDNDNYFLLGSNRVGMLMLGEAPSNDYNNLGEPLTWELRTAYNHYDAPAQYKRAAYFRPHFDTVTNIYNVSVGYATDYSDSPTYNLVALNGTGPRFDQGYLFDNGVRFGTPSQVNPTDDTMRISGQWRRLQIRYYHYGAREPVSWDGHVLKIETQRLV